MSGTVTIEEAYAAVRRAYAALLPDVPDAELQAVMGLIHRATLQTVMVEGTDTYEHGERTEDWARCAACGYSTTTVDLDTSNVDWAEPEYHTDDCWWLALRRLPRTTDKYRLLNAVKAARDELQPLVDSIPEPRTA